MSHKKTVFKETHQSIAEQTRSYLKSGGKIQQVPAGYTGEAKLTDRQHHFLAPSSDLHPANPKKPGHKPHRRVH
ncbi:hypothetical protein ACQUQP_17840 [Marinobacterium sp. YM272]|uniref:hypothetical protein n=1 Tax=Marinobacterium sp. YM272 TaxID=3421654 RepID=UPI003D7FE8B7